MKIFGIIYVISMVVSIWLFMSVVSMSWHKEMYGGTSFGVKVLIVLFSPIFYFTLPLVERYKECRKH